MPTISSPGIGSGLDVNSIISQLMAIERKPIDNLQTKAYQIQAQISEYGKLQSATSALRDAALKLTSNDTWGQGTGLEYSASAINGDIFLAVRLPRTGTNTDEFFWWRSATQDPIGSFGAGWDHPLDRALNAIRSVAVAPK